MYLSLSTSIVIVLLYLILSLIIFSAINDSIFLVTYLLIGLAPKDSLYDELMMCSFALSVSLILILLSDNLFSVFLIILSSIS